MEECRRENKILSEKLENNKDVKRELNTEDMLRDDESVKFYTGLPNLACFNFTLRLIQPYTKNIKYWDEKRIANPTIRLMCLKTNLGNEDNLLRRKSISWYFANCV